MPYIDAQDLITRFGEDELTQLAPNTAGDGYDSNTVAQACEDASGEIDGYVAAAGYPVPLIPAPRIVLAYAADIARYRLYDEHAPEQIRKRYEDAVKFLRAVSHGEVMLGAKLPEATSGSVEFTPGRQVFKGGGF